MTTWEQEVESQRKKEPQIPRPRDYSTHNNMRHNRRQESSSYLLSSLPRTTADKALGSEATPGQQVEEHKKLTWDK